MRTNDNLSECLKLVTQAMRGAQSSWWIIGSAAAALHGAAPVDVADVDVLLSVDDAQAILPQLGLAAGVGEDHPDFRSDIFAIWRGSSLTVEFMAGFAFRDTAGWHPVWPSTRQFVEVDGCKLPVPSRAELIAIMQSFGRPKDLERAALLRALG